MSENKQGQGPANDLPNSAADKPEKTRTLKVPEVLPIIKRGTPSTGTAGAPGADPVEDTQGSPLEGSDAKAYAALKAKRAERRRKKLTHRGIGAGIVLVAVLGGAFAVSTLNQKPDQSMEALIDIATQGTFSTVVNAKGTLQPLSSTVITPEVTGQIESINVVAGQNVNEGDVLMTIKNPDLDRAVAEADRNLRQARNELGAAQQALAEAKRLAVPAAAEGDAGARGGVAGAQASVNAAQAAVEAAQAAYDDAVAKTALRTVKSPLTGSVVALNAQVGVNLGDGMGKSEVSGPLMQVADLSKMKVTIQVEEEDIANVAVDQAASITCPAFPDLELTGRVTAVASIASGEGAPSSPFEGGGSPTFAVDILIETPDPHLKPGMTAKVSLTTQKIDNVIMVPIAALISDNGKDYYVNVETDPETHEQERRDVTVYAQNDDFAVIGKVEDTPEGENAEMDIAPLTDGEVVVIGSGSLDGEPMAGESASDEAAMY